MYVIIFQKKLISYFFRKNIITLHLVYLSDMKTFFPIITLLLFIFAGKAFSQPAIERFLNPSYMKGASVSILIKDIDRGVVVCSYDAEREVIPASVMKIVTTAAALEILGEKFRYETAVMYDGVIKDSVLKGNLYIRGSGDPTLGSVDIGIERSKIIRQWTKAIKDAGIREIKGSVIADDSIFDSEGMSMKWLREDIGSYYGQGCYGLNIYDNRYSLFLKTGELGSKPEIEKCEPDIPELFFHNYLTAAVVEKDSSYIVGFPYSNERYLYGTVPANRSGYRLRGDIPDPALFLAQLITQFLKNEGITVEGTPTCHRLLSEQGKWKKPERKLLTSSYSPPLKDIVRITNHVSSNLYADALLKTSGLQYRSDDAISTFGKGIKVIDKFWADKGLNTSTLWMFDGSGLAPTDKISAAFLCELLEYMAKKSAVSKTFIESLPRAGREGSVASFLTGSTLQGNARLKSGSMSRVRSYAGYVSKENKRYVVAVIVNNFSCEQNQMRSDIEQLFISLF